MYLLMNQSYIIVTTNLDSENIDPQLRTLSCFVRWCVLYRVICTELAALSFKPSVVYNPRCMLEFWPFLNDIALFECLGMTLINSIY